MLVTQAAATPVVTEPTTSVFLGAGQVTDTSAGSATRSRSGGSSVSPPNSPYSMRPTSRRRPGQGDDQRTQVYKACRHHDRPAPRGRVIPGRYDRRNDYSYVAGSNGDALPWRPCAGLEDPA